MIKYPEITIKTYNYHTNTDFIVECIKALNNCDLSAQLSEYAKTLKRSKRTPVVIKISTWFDIEEGV